MDANLETQGYRLDEPERRALWLGVRFSTGICLALTAGALALGSAPVFAGLALIGFAAGFGRHHPFDHLWNRAVRHIVGAPELPASPAPRRHAFKVAGTMLLAIAALLAVGAPTAALIVGISILAACTAVTAFNLCIPSLALSLIDRVGSGGRRDERYGVNSVSLPVRR